MSEPSAGGRQTPADWRDRQREAEAIVAGLRGVPPQQADDQVIASCDRAIALLEYDARSELLGEIRARLGSYLLELRSGDRAANVARARALYRSILDTTDRTQPNLSLWEAAACGYANTLVADPAVEPGAFAQALDQLDDVVTRLRAAEDPDRLAAALACYANVLAVVPTGDRDELLERAIAARHEQIAVLGSADRNPELWGRAHHNLARLYLDRRAGIRSENIDLAVASGAEALRVRTRAADPAGRARTLRGLAVAVREWSGATSQAEADASAAAFLAEAEELVRAVPSAAAADATWGAFASERPVTDSDVDTIMRLPPAAAVARLDAVIANHRAVLQSIPPDSMRVQWADWLGGLGRLLAKRGHFQQPEAIREAYECLVNALAAVTPASHPRMYRDLTRSLGDLCHQVGAWDASFQAFSNALVLSEHLFDEAAAPDSRQRELADMRGFAQFGAYAAARLGELASAVHLAEAARARSLVEVLAVAEVAMSSASDEVRQRAAAAADQVTALENEFRRIRERDAHGVADGIRMRLADHLGVDPQILNIRVTNPGDLALDDGRAWLSVAGKLRQARATLRERLTAARAGDWSGLPARLDAGAIARIATRAGHPLVYVLATVWGGIALIVPPDGPIVDLPLDQVTSDVTAALLLGSNDRPGYEAGALEGDYEVLAAILPGVMATIGATVTQPIADWLAAHNYQRATLIPIGRVGLFPIHGAALDSGVALGYAPSARALSRALAVAERTPASERHLLAVGDPSQSLPFARAEVQGVAHRPHSWARTTVLGAAEATCDHVISAASRATHLHFACHGLFRPSDPSESALLLAGEDRLTLGALLRREVDLSSAELAVLSACQTATSEFRSAPDEALGLPAGLLLAGIPAIIATMWSVDDRAAAFLCQRLYDELLAAGGHPAIALAAAQRWLRDATASELMARVESLRRTVADDAEAQNALTILASQLEERDQASRPFAGPECWAAFAYVGA